MIKPDTPVRVPGRPEIDTSELNVESEDGLIIILGPNGAGKTTLCQVLAGVLSNSGAKPTKANDHNGTSYPILVWQDHQLFPLSVRRNLEILTSKERTKQLLALFNLQAGSERSATELSGGERVRLAIARAIAGTTSTRRDLIFDEPSASVDPLFISEIASCIRDLGSVADNVGLRIVVTHDPRLVGLLGPGKPEVYVLEARASEKNRITKSKIRGPFPFSDFLTQPPTVFAAEFLGYENIYKMRDPKSESLRGNMTSCERLRGSSKQWRIVGDGRYLVVPVESCRVEQGGREQPGEVVRVRIEGVEVRRNRVRVFRCVAELGGGNAKLEFVALAGQSQKSSGDEVNLRIRKDSCIFIDQA